MDNEIIGVTVHHNIPLRRVEDLLTCAFEGGVGYWCMIVDYINPDGVKVTYRHSQLPLTENGGVVLTESSDDPDPSVRWILDREKIETGMRAWALRRPQDFLDFINEREDADTGDSFLQYCLFGELVYG